MSKTKPDATAVKIVKSDAAAWHRELTGEQCYVLRQHGTERPSTSPLNAEKRKGVFACTGCGADLFAFGAKFESGTGWPSFDQPAAARALSEHEDPSLFTRRIEVRCAHRDGHLGHVFPDGPSATTGLRYRINGAALKFKPEDS